jgi:membrane protease subunit (stomatin/prohibitin family)
MGLFDKLRNELIDIVEWTDDSGDTLMWRFPRYEDEIKNGAQLIVRPAQVAAFVNQGKLADVFAPGQYSLVTKNLPIFSTLQGWKYGFESPFKAEVYFVSTKTITDRKWGTPNPIMMRDPEFGVIRIRAFGAYAMRVKDPSVFVTQITGTDSRFSVDEIESQLRDLVISRFADALGASKMAALDMAGNYDKVGQIVTDVIQKDFDQFGIEIVKFVIENISLPAEVEAAMDKRASIGVIGNMQAFTQYESANAISDAAKNPGGLAGAGAGLAAGYQMASQMSQAMNAGAGQVAAAPPPIPGAASAYYLAVGTSQAGPFTISQLTGKLGSADFTRQTLVWKQGMQGWVAAETVGELANLFASIPPPIPKP